MWMELANLFKSILSRICELVSGGGVVQSHVTPSACSAISSSGTIEVVDGLTNMVNS